MLATIAYASTTTMRVYRAGLLNLGKAIKQQAPEMWTPEVAKQVSVRGEREGGGRGGGASIYRRANEWCQENEIL
jgi:hypothetical protein